MVGAEPKLMVVRMQVVEHNLVGQGRFEHCETRLRGGIFIAQSKED
jgi:hypothetical protein